MTTAILLVNLGTPDAATVPAVRRYLAEFLSDPRVVEQPRWLWLPLLHGVILPLRSRRSARLYQSIWTDQGSPLAVGTANLARALQQQIGDGVVVAHAMRYQRPSIDAVLGELAAKGLRRLLVIPLFPQYSATTTASVFDAIAERFRCWRRLPDFRFVSDFHDDPGYVDALASSIREHWRQHGKAQRMLLSFHGIPQRYVRNGDPYAAQVQATAEALRQCLGVPADEWLVTFQSRVGREPWLAPYTDEVLRQLPKQGVLSVQVVCPGFSIDCLETLEEIAVTNRELFEQSGGERYDYIPCLNDRHDHVAMLASLARRHLHDWS